jgi:hypothetical protein
MDQFPYTRASLNTVVVKGAAILSSIWSQLCVSASVGWAAVFEREASAGQTSDEDCFQAPRVVRSMDDYAGYYAGKGLGSLDIGGGRSRWGD